MGMKHSCPAPAEDDFLLQHSPPPSVMCKNISPLPSAADFQVREHSWNRWQPETIIDLQEAGGVIKAVSLKESKTDGIPRCLIYRQDSNELIAILVLEHPFTAKTKAVICSFVPPKKDSKGYGDHEGRPIYEWASLSQKKESHQFIMKSLVEGFSYETDYYGPIVGINKFLLKREGRLCACLELQKRKKSWSCKICPGIDPALFLCFLVCSDKLRESVDRRIEALSGSDRDQYKGKNMFVSEVVG